MYVNPIRSKYCHAYNARVVHARYKDVVDALAADVRAGKIPPGTRLPTHRELAAREGLALVTATRVYAELAAMGLVSGEAGRGTFVRETSLSPRDDIERRALAEDVVDLNFNYPSMPEQTDLLRTALRGLASWVIWKPCCVTSPTVAVPMSGLRWHFTSNGAGSKSLRIR